MNQTPFPLTRDIVLIGGGHTHALVLRKWGMSPLAGARLTLIDPTPAAAYSGMLPGHIAGHYARDALDIDLVRLARFAGARYIFGAVEGVDRAARHVFVPGRPPIAYDLCSIDIGVTSNMADLKGFSEYGQPAKPLGPFARAWSDYLQKPGPARVAVIGGGVAGAELALSMAYALKSAGRSSQVTIIERRRALAGLGESVQRVFRKRLADLNVDLREHIEALCVDPGAVRLAGGETVAADFVVGAAGARPYEWIGATGLELSNGFVTVGPTLQSSDPDIFAVGDCAHMGFAPRPKAGVFAVRQAPTLYANLRARASGGPLRMFRPQADYLKLISLGDRTALGEKAGLAVSGSMLWRLKNRIDQRFMDKFRDLPAMPPPALPRERALEVDSALGPKPLCGGCGAKVGRSGLNRVIAQARPLRDDVEMVPGDDAAVLRVGSGRLVLSTDHLRALTEDPVIMTRIAAIHALGDVWAMGAQPFAATVSLILPRLSATLQGRMLDEIMTTAHAEMRQAGADIVGGHTSIGGEFTIGFTVTGTAAARPITLQGAQAGDALILTKPLGSGVLMAAEMEMKARGDWVVSALQTMMQGQGAAAEILRGAHAMTDVTGFGLAGHLLGLCDASGLAAEIDLDATPFMMGARELSEQGVRSSLFAENHAIAPYLPDTGAAALLFDPQTAGGLLAAVAPETKTHVLRELAKGGYPAACVGTLKHGAPRLELVGWIASHR